MPSVALTRIPRHPYLINSKMFELSYSFLFFVDKERMIDFVECFSKSQVNLHNVNLPDHNLTPTPIDIHIKTHTYKTTH